MMGSHTWKTHTDPWRGVTKTAFGMDYMKAYKCGSEEQQQGMDKSESFVEDVGDVDWLLGLQGIDENGMQHDTCERVNHCTEGRVQTIQSMHTISTLSVSLSIYNTRTGLLRYLTPT